LEKDETIYSDFAYKYEKRIENVFGN